MRPQTVYYYSGAPKARVLYKSSVAAIIVGVTLVGAYAYIVKNVDYHRELTMSIMVYLYGRNM